MFIKSRKWLRAGRKEVFVSDGMDSRVSAATAELAADAHEGDHRRTARPIAPS